MTPSLWQANQGLYRDSVLKHDDKFLRMVYDYPMKRTDRNHLVTKGALFFIKIRAGWKLAGIVLEVVSTGTHPGTTQKYAELSITRIDSEEVFVNKATAIQELGCDFRSLQ